MIGQESAGRDPNGIEGANQNALDAEVLNVV
jgi:hypothetical protein